MFRSVTYVVAVHNEVDILEATVGRIVERLRAFPGSEVVLVENGSTDHSPELVRRLARELSCGDVAVVATESTTGFGHALRRGIEVSRGDLVVLTAADLPFGFSDFDQVAASFAPDEFVLGSKAHPDTRYSSSIARRVLSAGFRLLRQVLVGLRVGDSQGTVLVSGDWARSVCPHLDSGDYLVTTELAAFAARRGLRLREVPVVGDAVRRPSSVHPLGDSIRMLRGLVRLRRRLADERRVERVGALAGT